MNPEKMIKTEAKRRLSGRWPAAIFSLILMLFVPMIAMLLVSTAYSVIEGTKTTELFSKEPVKGVFFVLLHAAAVAVILLLSPLYCGFARYCGKAACGEESTIDDAFAFFENSRTYRNTVVYMASLLLKALGILLVCEAPALVLYIIGGDSSYKDTLNYVAVAFAIVGLCAAFIWLHRFAFEVMLFTCYDYDGISAVKVGALAARGHVSKLIRLTVSFVPWLLSTYFVVPLLYICPYITCAYFTATKYIINMYLESAAAAPEATDSAPEAENAPVEVETTIEKAEEAFDSEDSDDEEDAIPAADDIPAESQSGEDETSSETAEENAAVITLEKTSGESGEPEQ